MLKLQSILVWCLCLVVLGCGAEEPIRDGVAGGGAAAGGFGGVGGATGGAGGISGVGGAGAAGGVGGMTGGAGGVGGDTCAAEGAEAEVGLQGADIVWVVDNSCSMAVEAAAVQTNMNRFTTTLKDNGINVNLVLISSANVVDPTMSACPPDDWICALAMLGSSFSDFGVCIGAPFGSGMCPNDSVPPYYLHLNSNVGSTNGLQMAVDSYSQWSHMMRPGTSKHFVIITDDDSNMDAATFTQRVNALSPDPTVFEGWRFHGIYSFTNCPDAAQVGNVHQQLVAQTGGVAGDLCLQQFDPVFDLLAMDVTEKAEIACDWPIPAPPVGQHLDKDKVNVRYTRPDTTTVDVLRIPPGEDCGDREGWVYDNDETPTQVIACPASCDGFRATGGKVDVLFGCASVLLE